MLTLGSIDQSADFIHIFQRPSAQSALSIQQSRYISVNASRLILFLRHSSQRSLHFRHANSQPSKISFEQAFSAKRICHHLASIGNIRLSAVIAPPRLIYDYRRSIFNGSWHSGACYLMVGWRLVAGLRSMRHCFSKHNWYSTSLPIVRRHVNETHRWRRCRTIK